MSKLLPDDLNPGIRRTVQWLNDGSFQTCDSGDGKTHEHACDRDYPYVVIRCDPMYLVGEADRLRRSLREIGISLKAQGHALNESGKLFCACIQASYDPVDRMALIDLMGVDDAMLSAALDSLPKDE